MFKNLDGECFGIVGRQNEVIEFALSNGYASISVNFSDLVSRAGASGVDFATRYLVSAKKLNVGEGEFTLRLGGSEEEFNADMESLNTVFEIVDAMRDVEGANENRVERVTVYIQPYSDTLAYHENFELHRTRITTVAEKLAEKGLKLGLGIQAAASKRAEKEYEFIYNAEGLVTLANAITASNVGIHLNTWDWLVGGGALDQLSDLSVDKIIAVTLTDIPDGADLATLENTERLMPKSGDFSFNVKVCNWLNEIGYTGPITPGPSSSQFSGSSRDAVIHKASNAIDSILVEVGAIEPAVPEIAEEPAAEEAGENAEATEAAEAKEGEAKETKATEEKTAEASTDGAAS